MANRAIDEFCRMLCVITAVIAIACATSAYARPPVSAAAKRMNVN